MPDQPKPGHNDHLIFGGFTPYEDLSTSNEFMRYKGWEYVGSNEDLDIAHTDFVNRFYSTKTEFSIQCKGTDPALYTPWFGDNASIANLSLSEGARKVYEEAKILHQQGKLKGKKITISGHSRGGNEAQWWAVALYLLGYKDLEVITLNSPSNWDALFSLREHKFGTGLQRGPRPVGMFADDIINMEVSDFNKMQQLLEKKSTHYRTNNFPLNAYGTKYYGEIINLEIPYEWGQAVTTNIDAYLKGHEEVMKHSDSDLTGALAVAAILLAGPAALLSRPFETHAAGEILKFTTLNADLAAMSKRPVETEKPTKLLPGQVRVTLDPASKQIDIIQGPVTAHTLPCLNDKPISTIYKENNEDGEQKLKLDWDSKGMNVTAQTDNCTVKVEAEWLVIAAIVIEGIKRFKNFVVGVSGSQALKNLIDAYKVVASNKGTKKGKDVRKLNERINEALKAIPEAHPDRIWVEVMFYATQPGTDGFTLLLEADPKKPDPEEMLKQLTQHFHKYYNDYCRKAYEAILDLDYNKLSVHINYNNRHIHRNLAERFFPFYDILQAPGDAPDAEIKKFLLFVAAHGKDKDKLINYIITNRLGCDAEVLTAIADACSEEGRQDLALKCYESLSNKYTETIVAKAKFAVAAGKMGKPGLARDKAREAISVAKQNQEDGKILTEEEIKHVQTCGDMLEAYKQAESTIKDMIESSPKTVAALAPPSPTAQNSGAGAYVVASALILAGFAYLSGARPAQSNVSEGGALANFAKSLFKR